MQTKKLGPHLILNSIYVGAHVNKQPKATESNAVLLAKDNRLSFIKHQQRIFYSTQTSTET